MTLAPAMAGASRLAYVKGETGSGAMRLGGLDEAFIPVPFAVFVDFNVGIRYNFTYYKR